MTADSPVPTRSLARRARDFLRFAREANTGDRVFRVIAAAFAAIGVPLLAG